MQPDNLIAEEIDIACVKCGNLQDRSYKFCAKCGFKNQINEIKRAGINHQDWLIRFLAFYAIGTIVLLIIAAYTPESIGVTLFWSILFAFVDIGFTIKKPSVWKVVKFNTLKLGYLVLVFAVFIVSGFVVSYSMDFLNNNLFFDFYDELLIFKESENPLIVSIIFIAIFPAIFEELAFRGFVFDALDELGGKNAALWGSSFIFALVHFSLISIFWLLPFGLLLGYIRTRTNNIIYGMLGHFAHNLTVVVISLYL